jgi:hypothetical protein
MDTPPALKAPLALLDDLGLKRSLAVARRLDADRPLAGLQRLGRRAVAGVARPAGRLGVRLMAQVLGQLGAHRALDQAARQIAQQPAGPHDLRLGARPGQQLVDDPIGHLLADLHGKPLDGQAALAQPRPGQRLIDELIAQAGVTLARRATRVKLSPAVRVLGGHDAPVRSCLHSWGVWLTFAGG